MATKPRHLKTPLQLWVVDNRKRLGLTPADLASMTGVTIDTARGWESRGGPSEDALAILERRFGVPVPREAGQMGGSDVAAAIDRQTEVLRLLLDELRQGREAARLSRDVAEILAAFAQSGIQLPRRPADDTTSSDPMEAAPTAAGRR